MSLLNALGIDRYTRAFKTWIGNKFIAKGSLKTINNQSIEEEGNIETTIFTPESLGSANRETTTESRVYRAFYNIQNDEFTINNGSEKKSVPLWHINKITALGEIVNINIEDEHSTLQSCTAKVTLLPTVNIQFDYLDTHYTLTWVADTQSWGVTKTPINTGSADWDAQEGEAGYIENKTHYEYTQIVQSIDEEYKIPIEVDLPFFDEGSYIILKNDLVIYAPNEEDLYNILFIPKGTLLGHINDSGEIYDIQDCITDFSIGGNGMPETTIIEENNHLFIKHYNDDYDDDIILQTEIKKIDEKYLPDTVIKTTPQTLSDEDKNQVKENLGLGEVATKRELTKLSAEVSKKVDADFVNNAIAESLGTLINGDY